MFGFGDGEWERLDASVVDGDAVLVESDPGDASYLVVSAVDEPSANVHAAPSTVAPGDAVTLDASDSPVTSGDIVDYEWTVGDRRPSGETATVVPDEPGEHTVELAVTNDTGRTATTTLHVDAQSANETTPPTEDGQSGSAVLGFDLAIALVAVLALVAPRSSSAAGVGNVFRPTSAIRFRDGPMADDCGQRLPVGVALNTPSALAFSGFGFERPVESLPETLHVWEPVASAPSRLSAP